MRRVAAREGTPCSRQPLLPHPKGLGDEVGSTEPFPSIRIRGARKSCARVGLRTKAWCGQHFFLPHQAASGGEPTKSAPRISTLFEPSTRRPRHGKAARTSSRAGDSTVGSGLWIAHLERRPTVGGTRLLSAWGSSAWSRRGAIKNRRGQNNVLRLSSECECCGPRRILQHQ